MIDITDKDFEEVLGQHKTALVYFWAPWCGPCRLMQPILTEIENEKQLTILKLNIDENPEKTEQYKVMSIPHMILFNDGIKEKVIPGAKPKHIMLKELSKWI